MLCIQFKRSAALNNIHHLPHFLYKSYYGYNTNFVKPHNTIRYYILKILTIHTHLLPTSKSHTFRKRTLSSLSKQCCGIKTRDTETHSFTLLYRVSRSALNHLLCVPVCVCVYKCVSLVVAFNYQPSSWLCVWCCLSSLTRNSNDIRYPTSDRFVKTRNDRCSNIFDRTTSWPFCVHTARSVRWSIRHLSFN